MKGDEINDDETPNGYNKELGRTYKKASDVHELLSGSSGGYHNPIAVVYGMYFC